MYRIYNILVSILGESKQGFYDKGTTQFQFNCPKCAEEKGGPDNKYNLEISFSLGKYHCWSCNDAGPISKLIKEWGGKSLADEYFRIIQDIKENRYYDLELFKDNGDIFEEKSIKLPTTFRKIDLEHCKDKWLLEYLNKRKITQDIIDLYNIGYTSNNEEMKGMKNRLIIPSYDSNGDLNYWVGRDYLPPKKKEEHNDISNISSILPVSKKKMSRIKYKNCDADKNKIVFQEYIINWDADIYLVEGAIDCIYYHNAISMLGKFLKKNTELYHKLNDRANANIVICLDGDTDIKETKRIYNILNKGKLEGRIRYVRLGSDELPWKDFGEAYEAEEKQGIIKIMKSAKQFSEIETQIVYGTI